MRMPRIKLEDRSVAYHCYSRIVGKEALLDPLCQHKLIELMKQQVRFCGVQLITYCILSNHFHLLVRVPEKQVVSDEELIGRMEALYGEKGALVVLAREGVAGGGKVPGDIREKMLRRMGDVSVLMKELKQRFSRWYNRRKGREGTLWSERFGSTVVEDGSKALWDVAVYIDLNGVRAGLVKDPAEYGNCGYGAAVAGDRELQAGLMSLFGARDWAEGGARYRMLLYVEGGKAGESGKAVLEGEQIQRVLAAGGKLEVGQILRLRIRHMTEGLALGSEAFVEEVFRKYRDKFGPKRKSGARKIRGVPLEGVRVLRDLRVNAVG